LRIEKAAVSLNSKEFTATTFDVGKSDPLLGAPLTVRLPEKVKYVRLDYATGPRATGLQWMEREQTATKRQPFLYTQSQAIHARSWLPVQDSPGVRVTYAARIRTPKELRAVMSASNDPRKKLD